MRLLNTEIDYGWEDREVFVNDEVHWSKEEGGDRTVILKLTPPTKNDSGTIEVERDNGGEIRVHELPFRVPRCSRN